MELKIDKTYTGQELAKLCEEEKGSERYNVLVGRKAIVLIVDAGNDNWKVLHIWNPKEL